MGCKPVISYKCEELLLLAHHHRKVQFAAVFAPVFRAFVLFWLCRHAIRFTIWYIYMYHFDPSYPPIQYETFKQSFWRNLMLKPASLWHFSAGRVASSGCHARDRSIGARSHWDWNTTCVGLGRGSCGLDGKRLACSESVYEGRQIWTHTHTGSPDFDSIPDVCWKTCDMSMNRL